MGWFSRTKSTAADIIDDPRGQADEIAAQVTSLRTQVEALLNERVTPALADAVDRAETAVSSAREFTNENLATVTEHVHGQPLIALAIAAAIGYFIGRVAG